MIFQMNMMSGLLYDGSEVKYYTLIRQEYS